MPLGFMIMMLIFDLVRLIKLMELHPPMFIFSILKTVVLPKENTGKHQLSF